MSNRVLEFGEFRLDFQTVYRGNHQRVNLPQQTLGVLQVLLDHTLRHGNVGLESEALRQKAWPGIAVDKNN